MLGTDVRAISRREFVNYMVEWRGRILFLLISFSGAHFSLCLCQRERKRKEQIWRERERETAKEMNFIISNGRGMNLDCLASRCVCILNVHRWLDVVRYHVSESNTWQSTSFGVVRACGVAFFVSASHVIYVFDFDPIVLWDSFHSIIHHASRT